MVDFFKRKKEEPEIPPQFEAFPPLDEPQQFGPPPIQGMRARGMQNRDIVRDLTARGYPAPDIAAGFESPMGPSPAYYPPSGMPPPPPPPRPSAPPRIPVEDIERISEAIISEKWKDVSKDLDGLKKWSEEAQNALMNLSDRMTKLEMKLDSIETAMLGKVEEYGKGIQDVGTELKAMQRVFQTVMPTFTENIKELRDIVDVTKAAGGIKPKKRRR